MKIAVSSSFDPYVNLSTEETILKDESITENVILFYRNQNTIVIGRNQNAHEEINEGFVKENKINVIRRISGGGAVYQDLGNINFSFITTKKSQSSYERFLEPVIKFLNSLGVPAKFKGRNDVVVEDKKISGNAQYMGGNKMFHHGTLLFDSDLQVLAKALKPNLLKLESKSIKSARQRVTNIKPLLERVISADDFLSKMFRFFQTFFQATSLDLKDYKTNEIKKLAKVRKSHEWNYLKNPDFNFKNQKHFENGGTVSLKLKTHQNRIVELAIFGDFLSKNAFETIYKKFVGQDFSTQNLTKIVRGINDFADYFGALTKKEFLSLFTEFK